MEPWRERAMGEDGEREDDEDERIRSGCAVFCGPFTDAWHAAEAEEACVESSGGIPAFSLY
jgi:hypothetical protein